MVDPSRNRFDLHLYGLGDRDNDVLVIVIFCKCISRNNK